MDILLLTDFLLLKVNKKEMRKTTVFSNKFRKGSRKTKFFSDLDRVEFVFCFWLPAKHVLTMKKIYLVFKLGKGLKLFTVFYLHSESSMMVVYNISDHDQF